MITLSNENENPLWYNYTTKGPIWIGLAYYPVNLFLVIIIYNDALREVGCANVE